MLEALTISWKSIALHRNKHTSRPVNYSTPSPSCAPSAPPQNQKVRTEQWINNQAWPYAQSPATPVVPSVMSYHPSDDRMSMLSVNTQMTNQYPESQRCYSSNGSTCENVNPELVSINLAQAAEQAVIVRYEWKIEKSNDCFQMWHTTPDINQRVKMAKVLRDWIRETKFAQVDPATLPVSYYSCKEQFNWELAETYSTTFGYHRRRIEDTKPTDPSTILCEFVLNSERTEKKPWRFDRNPDDLFLKRYEMSLRSPILSIFSFLSQQHRGHQRFSRVPSSTTCWTPYDTSPFSSPPLPTSTSLSSDSPKAPLGAVPFGSLCAGFWALIISLDHYDRARTWCSKSSTGSSRTRNRRRCAQISLCALSASR